MLGQFHVLQNDGRQAAPSAMAGRPFASFEDEFLNHRTALEMKRVSVVHRHRMLRAFRDFAEWCETEGTRLTRDGISYAFLEDLLCRYVQMMRDSSAPFWIAKHTVLGVQFIFRNSRGSLRGHGTT